MTRCRQGEVAAGALTKSYWISIEMHKHDSTGSESVILAVMLNQNQRHRLKALNPLVPLHCVIRTEM